jgi:hypothetical protein
MHLYFFVFVGVLHYFSNMVCGVLCVHGLFLGVWQSFDMCILTSFFLFHDVMEVNEIWLQIVGERGEREGI